MSWAQQHVNRALLATRNVAAKAAKVLHATQNDGVVVPPEVAFHLGAFLGAMSAHHNAFLGTMETWDPSVGGESEAERCETCEEKLGEFERFTTGKGDVLCQSCHGAQIGGEDEL